MFSWSAQISYFHIPRPEKKRVIEWSQWLTQCCTCEAVSQYPLRQCSERCLLQAVIPGPAYFQESTDCICTRFILTFDCISLVILSDLKMYHAPVKGLNGANYVFGGFFSHTQNPIDSSIIPAHLCESDSQLLIVIAVILNSVELFSLSCVRKEPFKTRLPKGRWQPRTMQKVPLWSIAVSPLK